MAEKNTKQKMKEDKTICNDKFCPKHGREAVKLRGRTFEGEVISKLPGRVKIQSERVVYISKYERFDRRKTALHARLPDCMEDQIELGDWIKISECRPLSKIIHCIVTEKIRSKSEKTGAKK